MKQIWGFICIFCFFALFSGAPVRAAVLPICTLQGEGSSTPYIGQTILVEGVVTANFEQSELSGFFLQQPDCDTNPNTSDAVFVYTGQNSSNAQIGDRVRVEGSAQEYHGFTEVVSSPAQITPLGPANLPAPVVAAPLNGSWEPLEAMRVSINAASVTGPTNARGETWLIPQSGVYHLFAASHQQIVFSDGGAYALSPAAKTGDQINLAVAVIAQQDAHYQLLALAQPVLTSAEVLSPEALLPLNGKPAFTFASLNLHNLFDTLDDPATDDTVSSALQLARQQQKLARLARDVLHLPDILAVQEAENATVLQGLAARPELSGAPYAWVLIEGVDARGIDVGLLYRTDRVVVLSATAHQGCTTLVDGLGPDGNRDLLNPLNAQTCDTDGDGVMDGNRLFSRPPLLVQLQIALRNGELWHGFVLVNHWKSHTEDTESVCYTCPRRAQQAQFVAQLAGGVSGSVLVLGDLNDTPDAAPDALREAGLYHCGTSLLPEARYSYIYTGVASLFDQCWVARPGAAAWRLYAAPVNADYPEVYADTASTFYRASDHDPLLGVFLRLDERVYLPLALR